MASFEEVSGRSQAHSVHPLPEMKRNVLIGEDRSEEVFWKILFAHSRDDGAVSDVWGR